MVFGKKLIKQIHARVTRNRLTSVFFLFGFFHCFAQGIIQSLLFTVDAEYYTLLSDITQAANIPLANHTDLVYNDGGYVLINCNFIPHSDSVCSNLFDSRSDIVPTANLTIGMDSIVRGETILSVLSRDSFNITRDPTHHQVIFNGQGTSLDDVPLNNTCTSMLLYPSQHLYNSKREDIAFALLQFWLFMISVMAMMYDSVPHVLTVFITRITLTAWSIYALWRTNWQASVFNEMIETPGSPCSIAIFGQYFSTRILYEIPDLILNCTALGISAYLSWTLLRAYNAETFAYVGAPKAITKLYKYFLALQVCLQLEVFVLLTAAGLWADQLFNTYIHEITVFTQLYEALILCYAILIGPWLFMAWYGIRYEKRKITIAFIAAGSVFLAASAAMFKSPVYRWTFYAWPCEGCFITSSLILLSASIALGSVCLKNFGKGLSQYLYAEANLSKSNFAPEVFARDVESTYVDDEKLKASGLHADFTTHYLPTLGPSRDSYLDSLSQR